MNKKIRNFLINPGLLVSALLTVLTGFLILTQYHIGHPGSDAFNKDTLGLDYMTWSNIHKLSISLLFIFVLIHSTCHLKWYKIVLSKRLFKKNKQVISLTIIFVLVALTGFIPWLIDLMEGSLKVRKTFIEIHDKIGIILFVYLVLHVFKRLK